MLVASVKHAYTFTEMTFNFVHLIFMPQVILHLQWDNSKWEIGHLGTLTAEMAFYSTKKSLATT